MKRFGFAARMAGVVSLALGMAATSASASASENAAGAGLTPDAQQALAGAESAVDLARSKRALWTTAIAALAEAQAAAKKQDSDAVVKHAATASEQAFLGLAQIGYPAPAGL